MPVQIKIGSHRFDSTDANASVIQEAIDRDRADFTARLDAAEKAKAAADLASVDLKKRLDGVIAGVKLRFKSARAKLDAMKARMIPCEECSGTGKVAAADGKTDAKCDGCDGAGTLRFQDAIKSMPAAAAGAHADDDMEGAGEDLEEGEAMDGEFKPFEKKGDAKKRADARTPHQKRRADSIGRMVDRRASARASLLAVAGKHLGADEKFDGKSDGDVMRAVVAKLAPHLDAAKLDAGAVGVLYASETARADGQAMTASDALRAGMGQNAGGNGAARADSWESRAKAAADAKANAHKRTPAA